MTFLALLSDFFLFLGLLVLLTVPVVVVLDPLATAWALLSSTPNLSVGVGFLLLLRSAILCILCKRFENNTQALMLIKHYSNLQAALWCIKQVIRSWIIFVLSLYLHLTRGTHP